MMIAPDDMVDWLDSEDLIGYLSDEDLRCIDYGDCEDDKD